MRELIFIEVNKTCFHALKKSEMVWKVDFQELLLFEIDVRFSCFSEVSSKARGKIEQNF